MAVSNGGQSATSQDATITVNADTEPPVLVSAKAKSTRTEVALSFSERLNPSSAAATANYRISTATGSLSVTAADLADDGTTVTLTTPQQSLSTKYTVTVNNISDFALTPNVIAADSKAVFLALGNIVENADGFIVFETENYDRNLDGLWMEDTTRGTPSGGVSMVVPNGAGGSEGSSVLEYDVEFSTSDFYNVWYRASGDSGSDDSAWFHIDGERPFERADANDAAMTGFSGEMDFVWETDSFGGADPYTVDIFPAGLHVIGLARREDGSFFDKFILTVDPDFIPSGLGPPETREGTPALPTVALTAPNEGQTFDAGASITFSANASTTSVLDVARVEFAANGNKFGEASSPFSFTWNNVQDGVYAITATAVDDIGQKATSDSVVISVGNPPPQALLVVSNNAPSLNAADTAVIARLESLGWQVWVVGALESETSDGDAKQLIVVSSTIPSGDVADKFQMSPVPLINWEQALQDNLLMTGDSGGIDRDSIDDQTQLEIVNAAHPLAAGLSGGVVTVATAPSSFSWGFPADSALEIAQVPGDPTRFPIYAYETGAALIDGTAAPARRVNFMLTDDAFLNLNEDGLNLFDAAVVWASNIAPAAPTPTLSVARSATALTLTFTGTLQSADGITGPWTDVANAASPLQVTLSGGNKFYRAKN